MIDDDSRLVAFVAQHLHEPMIAIDTEFHTERTYWPKLALVQVAAGGTIALIDPTSCDTALLAPLLTGGATLIFHAGMHDIPILERATGATVGKIHDTQVAAALLGQESISLQNLLAGELGVTLKKGPRMTDWLARPLTDSQLDYAAADVAHLHQIAHMQLSRLDGLGRLAWAEQEFAIAVEAARTARTTPEAAIHKVREARRLTGKTARIAAAVAEWRENRARELDIPTRFVLSDAALTAIAERAPSTAAELNAVRGVNAGSLKTVADELLAAVANGAAHQQERRSATPSRPTSNLRAASTLVTAWVSEVARREHIATSMLATRDEIDNYLAGDRTGRLASGWRHELLADDIDAIMTGRRSLRVSPDGTVSLVG